MHSSVHEVNERFNSSSSGHGIVRLSIIKKDVHIHIKDRLKGSVQMIHTKIYISNSCPRKIKGFK